MRRVVTMAPSTLLATNAPSAIKRPCPKLSTSISPNTKVNPEAIADIAMFTPRSALRGSILSVAVHPLLRPIAKQKQYTDPHWITRGQLGRWFPATVVRRGEVGVMATTAKGTDVELLHVSQLVDAGPIFTHLKLTKKEF